MWSLSAWNSQTQLQYCYTSSIYEACTQMWGIIKTPARLLKCYAVFGVLAQLSTFPELLPLTKPGLLANKLNRPTQGLFSSAEWLGPSGPTANGSLNINLCPHVSAVYRLYFISNQNNKCETLYLQNWKNRIFVWVWRRRQICLVSQSLVALIAKIEDFTCSHSSFNIFL